MSFLEDHHFLVFCILILLASNYNVVVCSSSKYTLELTFLLKREFDKPNPSFQSEIGV